MPTNNVLFIDDNPNTTKELLTEIFSPYDLGVTLRHPEDVDEVDLRKADVVVVDYFLTDWDERDEVPSAARAPADGLAVAASLRSRLLPTYGNRHPGSVPERPVAFALWSGHLPAATFELPDVVLPYVFCRENNLEWAFAKRELLGPDGARQLSALAKAVRTVSSLWGGDNKNPQHGLWSALAVSDSADWAENAREDVMSSKPPVRELAARTRGMSIIRWLLHRILPYPTFLLNERELCSRLRVDRLSFEDGLSSQLLEELAAVEYSGLLADFSGRRWWRAGVEDWVFSVTEGRSATPEVVSDAALKRGAVRDKVWHTPVIVLGEDLRSLPEFSEAVDVVRVSPDDWPSFAEDAFATRTDASSSEVLRNLVIPFDRDLLDSPEFGPQ